MRTRAVFYALWRTVGLLRPSEILAAIAHPIATRMWPVETRKGIRIIDPCDQSRDIFVGAVDGALQLIEKTDPIRFARVKREIRTVLNIPVLQGGAGYSRNHRTCNIDLRCFPVEKDRESGISFMACMLVHEATHGLLFTKKIRQTERILRRVEKVCWNEEVRFARKIAFDVVKWDPFEPPEGFGTITQRFRFNSRCSRGRGNYSRSEHSSLHISYRIEAATKTGR